MEINEILISEEARRSFLIGLVFLSKADGNVDESEKYFFHNAANSLALSDESKTEVNACWEKKKCLSCYFLTRPVKFFSYVKLSNSATLVVVFLKQKKLLYKKLLVILAFRQ